MTNRTCICGAELSGDRTVCQTCLDGLYVSLSRIGTYYPELDTIRTRQVRFSDTGGPTSDIPLGMDPRFVRAGSASELDYDTRNTVNAWVREIQQNRPGVETPLPTPLAGCRFLLRHRTWFRTAMVGPEAVDELTDLENRLRIMIDRPPDQWFAGPCNADTETGPCPEPLYAAAERGNVECRMCGASYDVTTRRQWLLTSAENYEAPATVIARAITVWGESTTGEGKLAARIRQWGVRRRIFPVRHDHIDGVKRPLYRIGEVLDLLAEDSRREQTHRQSSTRAGISANVTS